MAINLIMESQFKKIMFDRSCFLSNHDRKLSRTTYFRKKKERKENKKRKRIDTSWGEIGLFRGETVPLLRFHPYIVPGPNTLK